MQSDVGRANDRIFLVMCSCGFDADVVRALYLHRTGHLNSASYVSPIMATIRHYDYPELHITGMMVARALRLPDLTEPGPRTTAFAGCSRSICGAGGGLQIAPQADAIGRLVGRLHLSPRRLRTGCTMPPPIMTGTHQWLSDFAARRSGGLGVTADAKVPFQLDGDPGGFLPVNIAVVPKRLTLVVPREKVLP